jgi:hypothetical protein
MIVDRFITGFEERFPGRAYELRASDATVVILGDNPAVGRIEVQDDGNELIVYVGDFTHGHFSCYDDSLAQDEIEADVVTQVLEFVSDVFADKVEFYRTSYGGGCRPAGTGPEESFTWSAVSKT